MSLKNPKTNQETSLKTDVLLGHEAELDPHDQYVEATDLGAVATSNDYDDLDNLPTIPDVSETIIALGGIATLEQKTYSARLPFDSAFTVKTVSDACVAGAANVNFMLLNNGVQFGPEVTLLASNAYQSFAINQSGIAGDVIQVQVSSAVGVTPPTNVTFSLKCNVQ